MNTIRWGILSTGSIAHSMATALEGIADAQMVAVGSRAYSSALEFANEFSIAKAYGSYAELAQDPNIDIIYIGSPHPYHYEHTMMCLKAGKAVLCEKPFALNAEEASEMIALARSKGLFLMEAMWTRFQPVASKVRQWLEQGRIGQPRLFQASFGFEGSPDPTQRWLNPELGGGALLDVGIYPLSYAHMVMGDIATLEGKAHIGPTGVDEDNAMLLSHHRGGLSVLTSSVRTQTQISAQVYGSTGRIIIDQPFFMSQRAELHTADGTEVFEAPHSINGYEYQAMAVHQALRNKQTESPIMPLAITLELLRHMDHMRALWGLRYPNE